MTGPSAPVLAPWRQVGGQRFVIVLSVFLAVCVGLVALLRGLEAMSTPPAEMRIDRVFAVDEAGARTEAHWRGHAYRVPGPGEPIRTLEFPLPKRVLGDEAKPAIYIRDVVRKVRVELVRGDRVLVSFPPNPRLYRQLDPVFLDISEVGGLEDGDRVRLTVEGQGRSALLRTVFLGPRSDIQRAFRWTRFLSVHLPMAALASAMLTVLVILAFVRIPARQVFLYAFAAVMACWVVRNLLFVGPLALLSQQAYWPVYLCSTLGVLVSSVFLVNSWTFNLKSMANWVAPGLALMTVGLATITAVVPMSWVRAVLHFGNVIGLVSFCLLIGLLIAWLLRARRPMWFETTTFLACILVGMIDLMGDASAEFSAMIAPGSELNLFYSPLVPIPLAIAFVSMVARFTTATREELETLNTGLTDRLTEQEARLEALHKQREVEIRRSIVYRERQRLMQDMHDGFGGDLLALALRAASGKVDQATLAEELRMSLQDLRLIVDAIDTLDGDFDTAVGVLRGRIAPQLKHAGLEMGWEAPDLGTPIRLGQGGMLSLHRIVQEAVRNVIQHSGATSCRVSFTLSNSATLDVEITDNGRGIPEPIPFGRGLGNIRQRVQQLGGNFAIENSRWGTTLKVSLPLVTDEADPEFAG
ncbi:MAG: ATP-binding protein [Pseudomonadota bacterium]